MFDAKATILGGAVVLWFAVLIAGLIGWILNIVKLVQTGFVMADWTGFEVARVVGVPLAPLGAVLGFL